MLRNYPLDTWYVAANADEVRHGLLAREIAGTPVVMFRRRSGAVSAFEDFCPHRSMPLSAGRLEGDDLVCGYHGFRYDETGACISVPSQAHPPRGARVRVFPVREVGPFVWIWMGEPRRADEDPPPVPWLVEDGWTRFGGQLHIDANYLVVQDNSLDLTHFAHVHRDLAPVAYQRESPPLQVRVSELTVDYSRDFGAQPLVEWMRSAIGLPPGRDYPQAELGSFLSPGLHVNHMNVTDPASGRLYEKVYVRGFTPQDGLSTHVFWWVARNFSLDDPSVSDDLRRVHEQLLFEDKAVVERVQAHALKYERPLTSELVRADAVAVRAHQIVAAMLRQEGAPVAPGPRLGFGMVSET